MMENKVVKILNQYKANQKKKMNKEHMKQEIASIKLIILSERQIITLGKKARPIYMLSVNNHFKCK